MVDDYGNIQAVDAMDGQQQIYMYRPAYEPNEGKYASCSGQEMVDCLYDAISGAIIDVLSQF